MSVMFRVRPVPSGVYSQFQKKRRITFKNGNAICQCLSFHKINIGTHINRIYNTSFISSPTLIMVDIKNVVTVF